MSKALEIINADIQSSIEASTFRLRQSPRICVFCKEEYGKYSCPRCGQLYCSLACYQSRAHQTCSSSFYCDNSQDTTRAAVTEVESAELSAIEKRRLLELVNEYEIEAQERPLGDFEQIVNKPSELKSQSADIACPHVDDEDEQQSSGSEGEQERWRQDLERRLTDLDLESAEFEEIWTRLTLREQADFIRLAQEHERHADEEL
ncbi:uncharacterized protein V1513DRAFT_438723 [Lipomyces chichibuensis]|uniref:uncharacterized protein n=1 Tax=Lipomyces chichibuensis TaxID=1546026 RepID=UPI00334350F0